MRSRAGSNGWEVVRKHWRGRGFVEIEAGHKHYFMTSCMRAGIRDFMKNHPRVDPEIILHNDDFTMRVERSVTMENGKVWKLKLIL